MSSNPLPADPSLATSATWARWLTAALVALLIVHIPAFICMPPDYDVIQWDLDARTLFTGQVLYRDVMENNLPGMLLWQAPVRAMLGWSSEGIRAADLAIVGLCIWLLTRQLPSGASPTAKVGTALVLASFYLTTNEWCHAQRDTWMLLPALLAFGMRKAACDRSAKRPPGFVLMRASLEGLLWGVAVWIKPFVIVAALTCWLASLGLMRRSSVPLKRASLDAGGLLLGGLSAGAIGLAWLWASGAWTDFWDIVFVWNREYVTFDVTEGNAALVRAGFVVRFFPWVLIHLAAVPLALNRLRRLACANDESAAILLSALYLGWLGQALLLQHPFDYTQVSPLFLAILLLCQEAVRPAAGLFGLMVTVFLACCALFRLLPLTVDRFPLLPACLGNGGSPEMRDRLSLLPRVNWRSLAKVEGFLRDQGIKDRELACLNMSCASLLLSLDVLPATRYIVLQNNLVIFARQRPRILAELEQSEQRYLVVDVERTSWKAHEPPPDERVVFTSGRYRVYALTGREMPAWALAHLELPEKD